MRCLTLADVLSKAGAQCIFASIEETLDAVPALQQRGYEHILPANLEASDPDLVIVDHYDLEDDFFQSLKNMNVPCLIIDDVCTRDFYPCDILLINNLSFNGSDYEGKVLKSCEIFDGPEFLLLRPQFLDPELQNHVPKVPAEKLFLFFGGTDPAGLTKRVLNIISENDIQIPHIDVVIGESNQDRAEIEAQCKDLNAALHVQISNMADVMKGADLAVGCGGTAIWERLSLNIPTLEISHSEWQIETFEDLHQKNYINYIGKAQELKDADIAVHLRKALENGLDLRYCPCGQGINALAEKIIGRAQR